MSSGSTSRGRTGMPPSSTVKQQYPALFSIPLRHRQTSTPSPSYLNPNGPSTSTRQTPRPPLEVEHQSRLASEAHKSRSPSPYSLGILDDFYTSDEDETHPTLIKSIDPSKYNYLFRLKPHLTPTNYSTWMTNTHRALQTNSLHTSLDPEFGPEDISVNRNHHIRWHKANNFVCSVLTASMTEEIQTQISHLPTAAEIWTEAHRLYAGTTATDWTLTIKSLVTTRYTDSKDLAAHIAKMKEFRRDLVLMRRDIPDELFACFLRMSMPTTWNYVFLALSDRYTSTEVKRRIRDEAGVRASQSTASSFHATRSKTSKDSRNRTPIPGQPYCDNCRVTGHQTQDCYSPGGPMHGKSRRDRKKTKTDEDEERDESSTDKSRNARKSKPDSGKANRAAASELSQSAYLATTTTQPPTGWILDSGTTNHICADRSAFTTFTPTCDHIKSIITTGPELEVLGTGTVPIRISVNGRPDRTIKLLNVHYCPNARGNLISESRMDQKGLTITKRDGHLTITKPNGQITMEGDLRGDLYEITTTVPSSPVHRDNLALSTDHQPDPITPPQPTPQASREGVSNDAPIVAPIEGVTPDQTNPTNNSDTHIDSTPGPPSVQAEAAEHLPLTFTTYQGPQTRRYPSRAYDPGPRIHDGEDPPQTKRKSDNTGILEYTYHPPSCRKRGRETANHGNPHPHESHPGARSTARTAHKLNRAHADCRNAHRGPHGIPHMQRRSHNNQPTHTTIYYYHRHVVDRSGASGDPTRRQTGLMATLAPYGWPIRQPATGHPPSCRQYGRNITNQRGPLPFPHWHSIPRHT